MATKDKTAERSKPRLPAPTLFVGPQSVNASRTSLNIERPSSSRAPLERTKSALGAQSRLEPSTLSKAEPLSLTPSNLGLSTPLSQTASRRLQPEQQQAQQKQEHNEALWAEMQNTLDEVELSAATTGAHVFGAAHSKALDELRTAQIALAQAWAKSETEEDKADPETKQTAKKQVAEVVITGAGDVLADASNPKIEKKPVEGEVLSETAKSQLEQVAEKEIALAKKRREANDRYFRTVNSAVKDVVAKLEEVAKAMKGVEQESKDIWGDKDSIETESMR